MYLIPITVPIYLDGKTQYIGTEWKRSLELLRDSLGGRYGPLVLAAPSAPATDSPQKLETLASEDGIQLLPLFDQSMPMLAYWKNGVHADALAQMAAFVGTDSVVHATVADPTRPFANAALHQARKAKVPSILVLDQDDATSIQNLVKDSDLKTRSKAKTIAKLYEYQARSATRASDLCMFKGDAVTKYGGHAKHLLPIEDTSYLMDEVADEAQIRARLADVQTSGRRLQFGFAGRLIQLKGVDRSLTLLAKARALGANVGLTIIGGGPQQKPLIAQAQALDIADHVEFTDAMPYGAALLQKLATCDALLFNPRTSETPRLLFDAYAAGLPIVADAIPYVDERARAEKAAITFPWNDDAAAIAAIVKLDQNRGQLIDLTENALKARVIHAADTWYKRRAEATHEMVDRVRAAR